MAYVLKRVGKTPNVPYHVYNCDTKADLLDIDIEDVPMGSRCYVIDLGQWFILNGSDEWKEVFNGNTKLEGSTLVI